jgi:hypothetical protein
MKKLFLSLPPSFFFFFFFFLGRAVEMAKGNKNKLNNLKRKKI